MNKTFAIEYFDVVPFMKQKQRRKKRKERDKNKEPRTRTREKQRKRNRKRGRPKKAKEKEGETLKYKQKMPFSRGKQGFLCIKKQRKERKKQNKKQKLINREGLGPGEVARKKQKHTQKRAFQLSVQFFLFFGVFSKFPFFVTLAQKACTQKNTIKIGVSASFFEKELCVTKRPFLDKKPKFINSSYQFFGPFSSLSTIENTTVC